MKVFKYPLTDKAIQKVVLPKDASILDIQVQYGVPTIWAAVDPTEKDVTCNLQIVGTGVDIQKEDEIIGYVGTFQLMEGRLVNHVFLMAD